MAQGRQHGPSWAADPLLPKGSGVRVPVVSGPLVPCVRGGRETLVPGAAEVPILSCGSSWGSLTCGPGLLSLKSSPAPGQTGWDWFELVLRIL